MSSEWFEVRGFSPTLELEAREKRRRTTVLNNPKFNESSREYRVIEVIRKEFCFEENTDKYRTLWSDGSKTWEIRENFIDLSEDKICEALAIFEEKLKIQ